jgi:hypothetical protein
MNEHSPDGPQRVYARAPGARRGAPDHAPDALVEGWDLRREA